MYILFFLMWVILNGKWTLEIVVFGLVIAAVMYAFICRFMDFSWRKDIRILKCVVLVLEYAAVLVKEIFVANVQTTRFILSGNKNHPVLVSFRTDLRTKTARVVLANSITLTPGTITVSLEENEYVVHCLDESMAEGLASSVFVRMLKRMEEKA